MEVLLGFIVFLLRDRKWERGGDFQMKFLRGSSVQNRMEKAERIEEGEGRFYCGFFLSIFSGFCVLG